MIGTLLHRLQGAQAAMEWYRKVPFLTSSFFLVEKMKDADSFFEHSSTSHVTMKWLI
jgi:hypothetical protein